MISSFSGRHQIRLQADARIAVFVVFGSHCVRNQEFPQKDRGRKPSYQDTSDSRTVVLVQVWISATWDAMIHQGSDVLQMHVINCFLVLFHDASMGDPVREILKHVFLEESFLGRTIGESIHAHESFFDMRQHDRSYLLVVINIVFLRVL